MVHGLYHGLGPVPIVGCDLWRVADGKIAEHWDARQPWADQTVSGHTMTDGPATVTEPDKTAASRKLVGQFVELIMMGGDRTQITRFFDGDRFIQHNPQIADGVSGLGHAIQAGVWAAVVERVHHIVAEGEFVFTQGEGILHGIATYILAGELALSQVLAGELPRPAFPSRERSRPRRSSPCKPSRTPKAPARRT